MDAAKIEKEEDVGVALQIHRVNCCSSDMCTSSPSTTTCALPPVGDESEAPRGGGETTADAALRTRQ